MRGLIGFSVLSLGLTLAAYSFAPDAFEAAEPQLAFASSQAVAATLDDPRADAGRVTTFSPGIDLVRASLSRPEVVGERLPTFAGRFAEAQALQREEAAFKQSSFGGASRAAEHSVELEPWRAAVMVAPSGVGPNGTQVSARYLTPSKRLELVTALQSELARVGCYAGEASGRWDRETVAALSMFMDRVNAVLPTHEPDLTLLELVKAHPRATCEATCPEGQSFDGNGRCVPLAVLAQGRKSRTTVASAADTGYTPRLAPPPLPPTPALPAPMALGAGSIAAQATASLNEPAPGVSAPAAAPPSSSSRRKVQKVVSANRVHRNYRDVQRLFEHPLGRM